MAIHGHILIRRRPEVVFDVVADERNTYDPSIHDTELLTGEPIGAGTRFRCTAAGRCPVEMTVEIVEYDRPHRLGGHPPGGHGHCQHARVRATG